MSEGRGAGVCQGSGRGLEEAWGGEKAGCVNTTTHSPLGRDTPWGDNPQAELWGRGSGWYTNSRPDLFCIRPVQGHIRPSRVPEPLNGLVVQRKIGRQALADCPPFHTHLPPSCISAAAKDWSLGIKPSSLGRGGVASRSLLGVWSLETASFSLLVGTIRFPLILRMSVLRGVSF